ncbi:MAG: lipocalin-like domain-containing protein [Bacteroidales bacterium]|nr:lipocalin-like domain-containing protein [Bacteroidales bacterium]
MNKIILFLFVTTFFLFLDTSCSDNYNSDLRGKWQLRSIETNGITKSVDSIFYNFDNLVFVMQNITHKTSVVSVFGTFQQDQDSLTIGFPDSKYGSRDKLWNYFQWADSIQTFKIIDLSHKRLCLKNKVSTLSFRKY